MISVEMQTGKLEDGNYKESENSFKINLTPYY